MDKKRPVWAPTLWTDADAYAVKAWADGKATEDQQQRAFRWVLSAARVYDQSFVPGSPDVSAFLEGHRAVGNQILKLRNLTSTVIEGSKPKR